MEDLIQVRLRKGKDDDIKEALRKYITPEKDQAFVVREALRAYFFSPPTSTPYRIIPQEEKYEPMILEIKEKSIEDVESNLDALFGEF